MAAVKNISQSQAPYASSTKDTTTSSDAPVEVNITFRLIGTISQIQADWATLIAATITANSSSVQWAGGQQ